MTDLTVALDVYYSVAMYNCIFTKGGLPTLRALGFTLFTGPSLPSLIEVGPFKLNTARGLENAVSSPSGVCVAAPAEIELGVF